MTSIERKAVSALKWATAAKLVVQIASWTGTLVIVRLLTSEDYGLMAKVGVVTAIAGTIAELGLESAIVRSANLVRLEVRKIYGVALLFSACMTMAIVAAAPLLASLFQEPRLIWPIAAASLQIMIGAIAVVPSALLARDLSFRRLSKIEILAGVVGISATLALALMGAGVWALVLGNLCGAITRSAALLFVGERVWPLFSMSGIGEQLKFGLTVVSNRVSYIAVVQSDILIGSAFLSTSIIGRYSVALQLATLPMAKVMGTINQIALPTVAQQQDDLPRVRQALLKAIGLISLAAFPTLWGISAVAPPLVRVLLGTNWLEAIPALTILPLVVPIRMVFSLLFTTALALGKRQLDLRNTMVNSILLPVGFFVGAHWGLTGLCSSWLVSVPLAYCFSVPPVLQAIGIRAQDVIAECGPPAIAAIVMYATVAALRTAIGGHSAVLTLVTLSVTGALVYFCSIAMISRRHLLGARGFARSLLAQSVPTTIE